MKKITFYLTLIILNFFILGCNTKNKSADPEPQSNTPKISQVFQSQLLKLLEAGNKLESSSSVGVNYPNFVAMLNDVRGSYSLIEKMWPEDFQLEAKVLIADSINVWNFEAALWSKKISREVLYLEDAILLVATPKGFQDLIETINLMGSPAINPDTELGKGLTYSSMIFKVASTDLLKAIE